MYRDLIDAFSSAASDNNVNAVVLTGTGKYYCSGNDLTNFTPDSSRTPQEMASAARLLLRYCTCSIVYCFFILFIYCVDFWCLSKVKGLQALLPL